MRRALPRAAPPSPLPKWPLHRAPSSSMAAGRCARATASTPHPLPLLRPIKAGQRSRITPHPSPLLLPRRTAPPPQVAGADLLLRRLSLLSKLLSELTAPSSFFWSLSGEFWRTGAHPGHRRRAPPPPPRAAVAGRLPPPLPPMVHLGRPIAAGGPD
jgi:hypothetical protein